MAQIHLEVVTPTGLIVNDDVDIVVAPGVDGEFGILANHAPFLSTVKTGTLRYSKDNSTRYLMVSGGFAEVSNNKATFLVESADYGQEIDVNRAFSAKERAEKRLFQADSQAEKLNRTRAEAALQRAVARIQTSALADK